MRGATVDVAAAGPGLITAATGLAVYADAMATAAAARDVEARAQALRSLSASAGNIAALAGVPGVGALGSLIANAERTRDLSRRRRALGQIAEAVDPAITGLSTAMTRRAEQLRENIALARSQAVVDAQTRFAAGASGPDRTMLARGVLTATADLRAAAAAPIDFSSLARAHRALVVSLAHPRLDPGEADEAIEAFAADARELRRSLGGSR